MFVWENGFQHEIIAGWTEKGWVDAAETDMTLFAPHGNDRERYSPSVPLSLLSSTKILWALKSMLPLLGQTVHSDHGQCKEFPRPCPDGPLGLTDSIMRMAKVVFHPLWRMGFLVPGWDNGVSKCHVKLAELCAIIQAFDSTNVFAPSSTSANTSAFCVR